MLESVTLHPHVVPLDSERAILAAFVMGSSGALNGYLPVENMVPSSRLHRNEVLKVADNSDVL